MILSGGDGGEGRHAKENVKRHICREDTDFVLCLGQTNATKNWVSAPESTACFKHDHTLANLRSNRLKREKAPVFVAISNDAAAPIENELGGVSTAYNYHNRECS